jgi:O-antigen ligase/Tfp pilus assembly protein PilF
LSLFFSVWLAIENKKLKNKKYTAFKNILIFAWLFFFLTQFLAGVFGVDPFFSFFSGFERGDGIIQLGFWTLYFLLLVFSLETRKDWRNFFLIFVISAFLVSLVSFSVQDKISKEEFKNKAIFGLFGNFGNPAYFAGYLIFALSFALILWKRKYIEDKVFNKFFIPLSIFVFLLQIVLLKVRGVYAGVIGGIFLFCILSILFLRKEDKKTFNISVISLFLGIFLLLSLFLAKDTFFVKNNEILSRVTQITNVWEVSSVRERILNWAVAVKGFQERPLLGWGPWNFGAILNKYYDWRIGKEEPWFDHPHNQFFGVLAGSGILGIISYFFIMVAVFINIKKIFLEDKKLAFILASTFFAYFVQSLFLFDIFPIYVGYFLFLAYLVYFNNKDEESNNIKNKPSFNFKFKTPILIFTAFFCLFLIYFTVVIPWKANSLAFKAYSLINDNFYESAIPYLKKSFSIDSPYTKWETRTFLAQLLYDKLWSIDEKTKEKELEGIKIFYEFMSPELELLAKNREWYPQTYFLVPTIYRLGYEKLQKNDLQKALYYLEKSFEKSSLRVEYYNNYAKILLLQGRFEEAERFYKDYVSRIPDNWGVGIRHIFLGSFYYEAEKYDLALKEYDKAIDLGAKIEKEPEVYPRYMLSAEKTKEYQKIVDMALKYLEFKKEADDKTYYNIAVGYFNLGKKEEAKFYFLKALELNPAEYEKYKKFFVE